MPHNDTSSISTSDGRLLRRKKKIKKRKKVARGQVSAKSVLPVSSL